MLEILKHLESHGLALLRMELGTENVPLPDHGSELNSIIGRRKDHIGIFREAEICHSSILAGITMTTYWIEKWYLLKAT